jgi:hypothetical protein
MKRTHSMSEESMKKHNEVCVCLNYRVYFKHPCALCRTVDLRLARFHADFFKPAYTEVAKEWFSFEITHPIRWVPKMENFGFILRHLDKNEENLGVMDFTAQKEFILCTNALGYPVHEFYTRFFYYLALMHAEINYFSWL